MRCEGKSGLDIDAVTGIGRCRDCGEQSFWPSAITEGTVNATGDRIFVDGQWQPYTQRNGVEVNIPTSRLNSANEEIAALKARNAELEAFVSGMAVTVDYHTAGDVLAHALHARNRLGLPLP